MMHIVQDYIHHTITFDVRSSSAVKLPTKKQLSSHNRSAIFLEFVPTGFIIQAGYDKTTDWPRFQ
jgi:hypothetical protein